MNWQKLTPLVGIAAALLSALFWLFQISAKADAAYALARDNKAALAAGMSSKADAEDIRRLDQDIRELRRTLEESQLIEKRR